MTPKRQSFDMYPELPFGGHFLQKNAGDFLNPQHLRKSLIISTTFLQEPPR